LKWVRAHIHHFGGDPDYLTVFGESAGGASVISHLYSQEPLFKKAISMSGTPILLKPSDAPMKEATYNTVMKDLGLENASAEDRLNRLRSISSDELAAKSPHFSAMRPFVDNDVVPASATFKGVSESPLPACDRKWCSELMIGDTQHDVRFPYLAPHCIG
jgi:carboxylesterase type B